jgi:zinc transport system permease protein
MLATVLGIIFTTGGLALSYAPDLPAGATIILLTGVTYLLSLVTKGLVTRYRSRKNTGS